MASSTQIAVTEYLHGLYEPDAEYVDGVIEERPAGEFDHARWQSAIQKWFLAESDRWNIWVPAELRVQVSAERFRVPDVVLIDRELPEEQIVTRPPIAVFEVLSPEDRLPRVLTKLQDYKRMGIRNIFVVDPKDDSAWRYREAELRVAESGVLEGSGCVVDWSQIRKFVG